MYSYITYDIEYSHMASTLMEREIRYVRIKPSENIAGYVRHFWEGEVDLVGEDDFRHFSIATSSAKLVFHYKGDFKELNPAGELKNSFVSGLQGQSRSHTQFISNNDVGIFGIEFYPYAIPSLFSISADAVTGQFIDLETLLGARGRELQNRILSATCTAERVAIATKFLESGMTALNSSPVMDAIHHIHLSRGIISIHHLAGQYNVSLRQFERLFKGLTGLAPKTYAKVIRFETAVSKLNKGQSLTHIALDSGYFDQSHFIHDFRAFTGLLPKDYCRIIGALPAPQY